MYSDTITLFNRKKGAGGDVWYPTVLREVDLNIDKAAITAKYGAQSSDNAMLHVRYQVSGSSPLVGGKPYLLPKEWDRQDDQAGGTITFAGGDKFDFFMEGEWENPDPISDNDFLDGFYNYMNDRFDHVFAITSVAKYSVIPHFEIMAK